MILQRKQKFSILQKLGFGIQFSSFQPVLRVTTK
jgi:hypothetical protein